MGQALVSAFSRTGAKVLTVSRTPGPGHRMTWQEVQQKGLPADTRAVINVSGLNILQPLAYRQGSGFWNEVTDSRVSTTRTLTQAILKLKDKAPESFVSMSGVGYYPYSETATYDESSPGGNDCRPEDRNFLTQLAHEWEEASSLPDGHPTRRSVIRSGVVIGPKGGIIERIRIPFSLGAGGPIGWSGDQFFPFISLHDLVRLFVFAANEGHVSGVLNGVSPQVIRNKEFAKAMGRVMMRPAFIPLPDPVVRLTFGDTAADMMLKGMRVVPKRTQELGFKYDLPDIDDSCRKALGYS